MRIRTAIAATALAASAVLGGAGSALADAYAEGKVKHSSGVLSGNLIQIPIHAPINVCGNTVNIIGLLNPAVGNHCFNK
ncbi:chaplin [Streptomyces agglomeratus]|uniref:Chaplin n=1 Tax=Streptomyces agglomeratus TaxID=285458 RepID=A0A1E5P2I3_9ACTN|nr:chaplin [Streptomyces agglomeratus]OEJ23755.1 chaplin [Streptomyces agglomeratus]OEJ43349.1 chaplin [Streptomyces agglomeratus]OEJ54733.1 chaplin [Streptomyces agglomeratus]OEJ62105.1 chaplin [Streptomyces agglomeratus]